MHVTPASHSLSDLTKRQILDDDQLQGVFKYNEQYKKLFCFFLDSNPIALVNHYIVFNLQNNDSIPILQSMNESSPPKT